MFLSGSSIYNQYDIVKLSNNTVGIITNISITYSWREPETSAVFTYTGYTIKDYSGAKISGLTYLTGENAAILVPDHRVFRRNDVYITNRIENQEQWKFQWVGIYWVKLIQNKTVHSGDSILKTGALIDNTKFIAYLNEASLTLDDLKNQDFSKIYSGQAQPVKQSISLPGIGILGTSNIIIKSNLALIYINDKPNLGKEVSQDLLEKLLSGQKPQTTSLFQDLASVAIQAWSISKAPVISVVLGFFKNSKPKVSRPHAYILLDGTPIFYVYIDGERYDVNNNKIRIEEISQERANYLEPQLLEVIRTVQILGKTDDIVIAINKLNSGNLLTPNELNNITKAIDDILVIQRNFIAQAQAVGVIINYKYEQKLKSNVPLTNDEINEIKLAFTKKLQEHEQQVLIEKQKETIKPVIDVGINLPIKPVVLDIGVIQQTQQHSKKEQETKQDLLTYYNQLPKDQQYIILAGAGLALLLLIL